MRARTWLVSLFAAVIFGAWATTPTAASIDISQVLVTNGKNYLNGVDANDYNYSLNVTGTGLTSVTVTGPTGNSYTLVQNGNTWEASPDSDFTSDAALRAAFPVGNYAFNFNGGYASLPVNFSGTEPGGIATGLTPPDGSTGVSTTPTFSWSSVPSNYGIGLHVMVRILNGSDVADDILPSMSDTSWTCPVTLDPGTAYTFEVDVAQGSSGIGTVDGTSFPVYSVYSYGNTVGFETTPEPATLSLLALGGLVLIRRRKKA